MTKPDNEAILATLDLKKKETLHHGNISVRLTVLVLLSHHFDLSADILSMQFQRPLLNMLATYDGCGWYLILSTPWTEKGRPPQLMKRCTRGSGFNSIQ